MRLRVVIPSRLAATTKPEDPSALIKLITESWFVLIRDRAVQKASLAMEPLIKQRRSPRQPHAHRVATTHPQRVPQVAQEYLVRPMLARLRAHDVIDVHDRRAMDPHELGLREDGLP